MAFRSMPNWNACVKRVSVVVVVLLPVISVMAQTAPPPLRNEPSSSVSTKPSDSLESLESLADKALDTDREKKLAAAKDAVTNAKEAIRTQPTDGLAWGKLGTAYRDLGDYKNAEEATKKAVEIFTERFKSAPPQWRGSNEASNDLGMIGIYYEQLAEISENLHKSRQAALP